MTDAKEEVFVVPRTIGASLNSLDLVVHVCGICEVADRQHVRVDRLGRLAVDRTDKTGE